MGILNFGPYPTMAGRMMLESENQALNAIDTSSQGLSAAQQAQNFAMNTAQQTQKSAGTVEGYAKQITGYADSLNPSIGNLNIKGDDMYAQGGEMYRQGQDMYQQGQGIYDQGKRVIDVGESILALDPNASGLAGELIKAYHNYDPNRMVSIAAADVQASYDNARGQLMRNLSRTGVAAGSGSYAAMMNKLHTSAASALAGAKTRARMSGMDAQTNLLNNLFSQSMNAIQQGAGIQKTGVDAQSAGINAQSAGINAESAGAAAISNAAGLIGKQGDLMAQAGGLMSQSANMRSSAAQIVNTAASNTVKAYDVLATAQANLQNFYMQASNAIVADMARQQAAWQMNQMINAIGAR